MIKTGLPLASFAALIAIHWKTPVWRVMLTITIIPIRRKMVFQSVPSTSSCPWKAVCWSIRPKTSITAAPARATLVLWTRSEAMTM